MVIMNTVADIGFVRSIVFALTFTTYTYHSKQAAGRSIQTLQNLGTILW